MSLRQIHPSHYYLSAALRPIDVRPRYNDQMYVEETQEISMPSEYN